MVDFVEWLGIRVSTIRSQCLVIWGSSKVDTYPFVRRSCSHFRDAFQVGRKVVGGFNFANKI